MVSGRREDDGLLLGAVHHLVVSVMVRIMVRIMADITHCTPKNNPDAPPTPTHTLPLPLPLSLHLTWLSSSSSAASFSWGRTLRGHG